MPRGSNAKVLVERKIAEMFGDDYVGSNGGKVIVWADDGGERVQIALAMTCPKEFVENGIKIGAAAPSKPTGAWEPSAWDVTPPKKEEEVMISDDEQARIEELMRRVGLL